jgi:hypothetical protein
MKIPGRNFFKKWIGIQNPLMSGEEPPRREGIPRWDYAPGGVLLYK